jgi:hypothetical protein
MSETQDQTAAADTKPKKAPVEVTTVKMADGREVGFAGKRKMLKTPIDGADGAVGVRFDFLNGETRTVMIAPSDKLFGKFAQHGLSQKVGDETAGDEKVEDCVLHVDAIVERLGKGDWGVERTGAGDGFSGASVVIKAIMEATGKDINFVKAHLETKLAAGKEAGLTRQKLYAAFRAPNTRTAAIIARLEAEKASKESAIDGEAALAEMSA